MNTPRQPSARTRLFALLGDPVAHSHSPLIQNAALACHQLDGVYVALRCTAAHAPGLLRGLALAGGGGNVTAPHKQTAAAALDRATDMVRRTRACNTFWAEGSTVAGDNTDVEGFAKALENHFESPSGQHILLVGAGGAARSVVAALAAAQCARVDVLTRTPARIEELKQVAAETPLLIRAFDPDSPATYHLAVQATPMGLHPHDALPLTPELLQRVRGVLDLVYAHGLTPLVRAARAAGLPAFDGTEMLLQQAALAFERWWEREAPVSEMRRVLADPGAGPGRG